MKDSKYIELLRHYVTEKIDESVEEISNAQTDRMLELFSTAFSAIVSAVLADIYAKHPANVPGSFFVLVIVLFGAYYITRYIVLWILKIIRLHSEKKAYVSKKAKAARRKRLITKFDNVACDNLIAAYDFLSLYKRKTLFPEVKKTENMREYYLFEAFYYYKNAMDITNNLIMYKDCIDCIDGVSKYRIVNVINILSDIKDEINMVVNDDMLAKNSDLRTEMKTYTERFEAIKKNMITKEPTKK